MDDDQVTPRGRGGAAVRVLLGASVAGAGLEVARRVVVTRRRAWPAALRQGRSPAPIRPVQAA